MRKIIYIFLLISILLTQREETLAYNFIEARVTESNILLNGYQVECTGFNIFGNNYFKLRDLSSIFSGSTSEFDVLWNSDENTIEIITGKKYTPPSGQIVSKWYRNYRTYEAIPTSSSVKVNGIFQNITAYNIDGNNYFKLRDLGKLIPFDLDWDGDTNTISLMSKLSRYSKRTEAGRILGEKGSFHISSSNLYSKWRYPSNKILFTNNDKSFSILESRNSNIYIDTYDENFKLLSSKSIEHELPILGGFFSGEKYNFIAFGQENYEENNDKEVIRIVKYDKNFKRISSVSLDGETCYTVEPFDTVCGMAERDNELIINTSRIRYKTDDGFNHQSSLVIAINTDTMTVELGPSLFQRSHVSHSFDQYVLYDGEKHVLLNHGDGAPRAIVLQREYPKKYETKNMFEIPGEVGANSTGVTVGGFADTSGYYIVAMNTIDHSLVTKYRDFEMEGLEVDQRDIILAVVSKNELVSSTVKHITVEKYIGTDKFCSKPSLVKISDEKLMIIWQEYHRNGSIQAIKYVFVDEKGSIVGKTKELKGYILSGEPIIFKDKLLWYYNEYESRVMNAIPLNSL